MDNAKALQPNELAQQLAQMPENEQRLVLAYAQGVMTRAALNSQNEPA